MSGQGVTLGAVRRMAAKRLAAALGQDDTPALDARLLIAAVLGIEPNNLVLADYRAVSSQEMEQIDRYLTRRIAGEPVARIVGFKEFWGLDISLSADTLVPRPDTETVVSAVLDYFERRGGRERALRIVDIGTGSGAILVALLSQLPAVTALGIDFLEGAVRTARENAEKLGFADRALFIRGNWAQASGEADVIVSNPPYIVSAVIETLASEVRDFDPPLALDGGFDGLDAYRSIIGDLDRILAPDGAVFLEIGFDQALAVSELLSEAGFETRVHKDLAGHDRVIEASRVPNADALLPTGQVE